MKNVILKNVNLLLQQKILSINFIQTKFYNLEKLYYKKLPYNTKLIPKKHITY